MEDIKSLSATPESCPNEAVSETVNLWELIRLGEREQFLEHLKNESSRLSLSESLHARTKRDRQGNSIMHIATLFGQNEILNAIIDVIGEEHLPTYTPVDSSGLTPIHFAGSEGHLDCLETLLKRTKIPVDGISKDIDVRLTGIPLYLSGGKTALHFAAEKGHLDVVAFLVGNNWISPTVEDFDGSTALDLALSNNQLDVAQYLDPNAKGLSKQERQQKKEEMFKKCRDRVLSKHSKNDEEVTNAVTGQYVPLISDLYVEEAVLDDVEPDLAIILRKHDDELISDADFAVQIQSLVKEMVPGSRIYSLRVFTAHACEKWYSELSHYESQAKALGLPLRRPNSMNNYGIVLNDIGLGKRVSAIVKKIITPLSSVLLPDLLNKRGGFKSHHSFSVQYKLGEDIDLATHVDASDVTLNICLGKPGFSGAGLYFHKMRGAEDDLEQGDKPYEAHPDSGTCEHCIATWEHEVGVALLHPGMRIHGVNKLKSGERGNLIVWCKQ
eukprot:TRINITY_DN2104_c2_g1_i2.p1 TRINITY_DN2104_c2_g1~~TRINITY_DN2104_c2_g1_i2.p1  ORF type:complete len:498 (-),score=135.38 TRINITY_DN2104_c2_g1_i2:2255-3748(-)